MNSYDNLSAMSPHEILNCINKGEDAWKKFSELSEIEKLEKAYSLASKRAQEAFKASLAGWLFTGFGSALFWYILANEPVPYNSSIPKITVIGTSLFSFVLFVLIIFAYLKHKEYDKELFAIQLKKTDKAEISIKL
ncbi:MAG: hypothetical protein J7L37_09920 [Thermococcus sp.]|nr:hypothetical protein [Thermococcus sp.]